MFKKNQKAFTALETLLAIGIMAATAGVTVPMYRNYQIRTDLDTVTEQTIQGLRRAQILSQSGEQDVSWGYYVRDGVLFAGDAYAVRDTNFDEVFPVPATINTSGLTEVVFSQIEGIPDRTGEIIIEGLSGQKRIILVGTYGVLESAEIVDAGEVGGAGDSGDTGGSGDTGSDGSDGSEGGDGDTGSDGSTGSNGDTGSDGSDGGDSGGNSTGGSDGGGTGGTGGEPTCEDRFLVKADGTIETTGTVSANFQVLGSAITYGAGGPAIDVRVEASVNNGETWFDLFNGNPVEGGESETVSNLVSGSKILVRINGRYSWIFRKEFTSNDGTGHIEVLRNGDSVPDYPIFGNQNSLTSFLRPIIVDGQISIDEYDAVYLVELGNLGTSSADFQDAVLKVSFALIGGCATSTSVPRFKVEYPRLENIGDGDAKNHILIGEQGVPYSAGQWVPLENENGDVLLDNFLTEEVEGMAAWRNASYIRFLQHGSHSQNSKEIVDALITFENVTVFNIENDTNQNKTESPFDNIVNDGAGGDEVTLHTGSQSILYQTRVTTADDAILVYWQKGNPPGSTGGTDGGSDGGSDGGTDGGSDGGSDGGTDGGSDGGSDGGGGIDENTPDPCAVSYTIANGVVQIHEPADITFRSLGSHAFYGSRGPEISTYAYASIDGGSNYQALFDNRDIDGGERQTFSDVASGAQLYIKGDGRYSWQFRNSVLSSDTERVKILSRNNAVPGTTPYQNIRNLASFMRNIINDDSRIDIGKTSLVYLFELQTADSDADFQDIAIEVFLEKPASGGLCGGSGNTSGGSGDTTTGGDDGGSSTGSDGGTDGGSDGGEDGGSDGGGNQVTICHFPPGNKKNPQTITVGESAVKSHKKNHGDRDGPCESDEDGDTVPNSLDLCPDTYMPETVPTTGSMLFGRYALTKNSTVFTTGPRKKFVGNYNINDTKGCSCEQLINVAEKKKEYHFKQYSRLYRNIKSLFPFYTRGARSYGCGEAILRMVKNYDL